MTEVIKLKPIMNMFNSLHNYSPSLAKHLPMSFWSVVTMSWWLGTSNMSEIFLSVSYFHFNIMRQKKAECYKWECFSFGWIKKKSQAFHWITRTVCDSFYFPGVPILLGYSKYRRSSRFTKFFWFKTNLTWNIWKVSLCILPG